MELGTPPIKTVGTKQTKQTKVKKINIQALKQWNKQIPAKKEESKK